MNFTQHNWVQNEIINKMIILTKQGTDMIHAIITAKYQKFTSTTILKHTNVLAKVNKLPYVSLKNTTPHYA